MKFRSDIWTGSGLDYNNLRKLLDITNLRQTLETLHSFPGIYSFTGNDYIPSFYGKIWPMKLMKSHERFIEAFKTLGGKT